MGVFSDYSWRSVISRGGNLGENDDAKRRTHQASHSLRLDVPDFFSSDCANAKEQMSEYSGLWIGLVAAVGGIVFYVIKWNRSKGGRRREQDAC